MKQPCAEEVGESITPPFVDTLVTVFANAFTKKGHSFPLQKVLDDIRNGVYQARINTLHKLRSREERLYSEAKRKLPAFCISGIANDRKEAGQHSGLLQIDLDELNEQLDTVREKMKQDPHIAFGFVSPSGAGLKLGVRIDGNRHGESFSAAEAYFADRYGLKIDPRTKDRLRLCFVSRDPDLWVNPQATLLHLSKELQLQAKPLQDYVSTKLHNGVRNIEAGAAILSRIKAKRNADSVLSTKNPRLARLYTEFIESRFLAEARRRNDFLVKAVPFLYRAVAPKLVLELVGCFYDGNRELFKDSRQQHMKEAEVLLDGLATSYAGTLDEMERQIYESLPDREREAFRICRDLALLPNPEYGPLTFYLSCDQLSNRLDIFTTQSQRVLHRFCSYGLLDVVQKGARREAGVSPRATVYRWLCPSRIAL